MGQVNSGVKERLRKLYGFMLETRGHSVMTTVRIACNKAIYIFGRAAGRDSQAGLVHAKVQREPIGKKRVWTECLAGRVSPRGLQMSESVRHTSQ